MIEDILASGISRELIVIIISTLPIVELRGAMPVAINVLHMPWYQALFLSFIGNMIPVPILLFFLETLAKLISRVEIGRRFINWIFQRTRKRTAVIEKYERIGLMLFVAIPLPFTGAWTGSIAAFLMGLKLKHSFLSITAGVIIAGLILTALSLLGWIGAAIAVVVLICLAITGWWKL